MSKPEDLGQPEGGAAARPSNPVIEAIMNRSSVRRFEDREVPEEILETIVAAGRQAPFTGQMYSVIVIRERARREELARLFGPMAVRAPVFLLICVDFNKLERFVAAKGRKNQANDLALLFLGIQDAAYFGQNLVLAADSLGLGSCFLGGAAFHGAQLSVLCDLPRRVYPLVGLVLGYPAGRRPGPRPRVPLDLVMFHERYRDLSEADVERALGVMDAGLIREGYYRELNGKIPLQEGPDKMTYDEYGWGEHVSRKYGQHPMGRFLAPLLADLRKQGIEW
ncbi:MAG: nitroreductase family protein [Bacillota bacterium]